jgi:class 3 adenylate cyclase
MSVSAHRKVVTVLFCDVVGSTALGESVDPEALQGLLARYFERMKGIVESHGGSVEKFIGDAVMAVFGVPVVHEDDALRACRAAVEMRDALPELGVEGRIGVNTGEVLTGTEERLATGDAVNVAARLEQAAEAGEVLLGAQTLRLVAPAVEVGEERLLELKGKSEPVAAHPLLAVQEAPERSHASRFIGRERELAKLVDAWERALAGPGCQLVTVVGDAGVGKSRLVAEALDSLDARVVRGRCLPYGEGRHTYVPLGRELCALGRFDEAEALARRGRELAADDNIDSGLWRQVQARVLAHRGEHSEAERLAREAVARVDQSDNLPWQGDAWCELAEVLEAAGRRDAAIDAWHEAHDRYERKGIIPLARRVRERLAATQPTQA